MKAGGGTCVHSPVRLTRSRHLSNAYTGTQMRRYHLPPPICRHQITPVFQRSLSPLPPLQDSPDLELFLTAVTEEWDAAERAAKEALGGGWVAGNVTAGMEEGKGLGRCWRGGVEGKGRRGFLFVPLCEKYEIWKWQK